MKRTHALLISLALGIAVIAGSFAALRSQNLAQQARGSHVSAAQLAQQTRALDRAEAQLRAELRRRPPAIPVTRAATPAAPAAQPATVVYRRPAPIVHVIHRHGGEQEAQGETRSGEGGGDD